MKETIDLLGKIITNILTALYEPFGFSLLLSFLAMFFYLYAYEPIHAGKGWKSAIVTWYQKFKESVFFRKLFLLAFVTSMILFRTLLNRNLWLNPLSDVMGGWGIWETVNGEQKLTTECIENVIMMMPFTSMVIWTFQEKVGSSWKKILWYSGKIALIFSISIEMLQLFLRLGTFQLSDLFYNTVGGMIGGLMYYEITKAKKHPFRCRNLRSVQPTLRHLIDFITVQHQVGCESVMLVKKDVLVLNGQKLVQGMQVHKQLMLKIMSEGIAAHHLLCLFVQLAIDKNQWLIKIERK